MATTLSDALTVRDAALRPLRASECVLAVVDIQERLLQPIFEKERLLRNAQLLVRLAGMLSIPAVLTTQYARGLGRTVPEITSLLPGVQPIDKLEFGCFGSPAFCTALAQMPSRNTLLVCGMEAHICVLQTVLGALAQGRIVHVAADAVSSRTELNWKLGLERMKTAGAVISSTEMMIYELLGQSGTPAFKEILQYLK
ncbi:MAG TPA: isochorismatase family protein [Alphaproteobacteria bacterium]|nr:isochorismatase family protein [Alphaproteobacteria bacterium]